MYAICAGRPCFGLRIYTCVVEQRWICGYACHSLVTIDSKSLVQQACSVLAGSIAFANQIVQVVDLAFGVGGVNAHCNGYSHIHILRNAYLVATAASCQQQPCGYHQHILACIWKSAHSHCFIIECPDSFIN